jgi:hypothetical protein
MSTSNSIEKCAELLKDNNALSKLKNPDEFKEQLKIIKERTPYILADFKNVFVLFNKDPQYPDYQRMFANIKSNVTSINSQLFSVLNDVQFNIDELNKKLFCLNGLITQEKQKNRLLKRRSGLIEEKNSAASELIYDYKNIYEEGYLRNWALVISIIIVGILIKNLYGNINGEMNSNVSNIGNNLKNMGNELYKKVGNINNK